MTFDPKKTGKRIRALRESYEISLTKAALDLCVSREHIRRIETGNRAPSIDLLVSLSVYYNTTIDYLLKGKADNHVIVSDEMIKIAEQLIVLSKKI